MMNGNGKCRTTRRHPARFQSRQGWDARRPLASLRPVGNASATKKVTRSPRTLRDRWTPCTRRSSNWKSHVIATPSLRLRPVGYVSLSLVGQISSSTLLLPPCWVAAAALLKSLSAFCVAKADVTRFLEHLRRCRGSDTKVVTELSLRQPSGAEVPVQLVSSPLPTHSGPVQRSTNCAH